MATRYGYILINELWKMADGTDHDAQWNMLSKAGATVFETDYHSGTQDARIKLNALVNSDRLVDGDTLIVQRLGVLSHSGLEAAELVRRLVDRGVAVEILDMGRADGTEEGEKFIKILVAVAEFAHESYTEYLQVKRTAALEKGEFSPGRPKDHTDEAIDKALNLLLNEKHTYDEVVKATGISKSTLHRKRRLRQGQKPPPVYKGKAKQAAQLAKKMNSTSVRKNISEWRTYSDQLYSLFYDGKPTEEIAVLFARGLATPPYKYSFKERKDNHKNIEDLAMLYNENVYIAISLVKGYVFWVLVQPLDAMVNLVCDFLERIAYRYIASAEVYITLSKELLRAMKDATLDRQERIVECLDAISAKHEDIEAVFDAMCDGHEALGKAVELAEKRWR